MANPFLVLGGVAVGVITAGIGALQVPGWVNSANDSAAISDLSQVALAQESAATHTGRYTNLTSLASGNAGGVQFGVRMQPSEGVRMVAVNDADANRWVTIAFSKSGYAFVRTSESTTVYKSDRKYAGTAALATSHFAGLAALKVIVAGTAATPRLQFGTPLPTASSSWVVAHGATSDWPTFTAPDMFVHAPGAAHSAILTPGVVNQTAGFTASTIVRMTSGTPLGGIALSNGTTSFAVLLDARNTTISSGSSASLHIRRATNPAGAVGLAGAAGLQLNVDYLLVVKVTGNDVEATVINPATGAVVASGNTNRPFADFTGVTNVGVYGHNGVTLRDLRVE